MLLFHVELTTSEYPSNTARNSAGIYRHRRTCVSSSESYWGCIMVFSSPYHLLFHSPSPISLSIRLIFHSPFLFPFSYIGPFCQTFSTQFATLIPHYLLTSSALCSAFSMAQWNYLRPKVYWPSSSFDTAFSFSSFSPFSFFFSLQTDNCTGRLLNCLDLKNLTHFWFLQPLASVWYQRWSVTWSHLWTTWCPGQAINQKIPQTRAVVTVLQDFWIFLQRNRK